MKKLNKISSLEYIWIIQKDTNISGYLMGLDEEDIKNNISELISTGIQHLKDSEALCVFQFPTKYVSTSKEFIKALQTNQYYQTQENNNIFQRLDLVIEDKEESSKMHKAGTREDNIAHEYFQTNYVTRNLIESAKKVKNL